MSQTHRTTVGVPSKMRQKHAELEERVQELERRNPRRSAAQLDRALAEEAPVEYGRWLEETPVATSRYRAIQRWRTGARGRGGATLVRHVVPFVWPVGERQRREVDPAYPGSPVVVAGSWRVFLYNCGPEVIRDVRVFLDRSEVDYAPSILMGKFSELHWQRIESLKSLLLGEIGGVSRHHLRIDFVVAKGTRQARVEGDLSLDVRQGWVGFTSRDGRTRELE